MIKRNFRIFLLAARRGARIESEREVFGFKQVNQFQFDLGQRLIHFQAHHHLEPVNSLRCFRRCLRNFSRLN